MAVKRKPPGGGSGKCPVAFALDIFGDRWSLLILRDLLFKDKRHYGEFLKSSERISTNILADRLAKLEAVDVVCKRRDPRHQSRYIYSLTPKGEDLLPLLLEMVAWSARYDPQPSGAEAIIEGGPAHLLERLETDRAGLIAEILDTAKARAAAAT